MEKKSSNKLNHFTQLPRILTWLEKESLILADPEKWEDQNDVEMIKEYKTVKGIKKLFAICFCNDAETIHHWKAYAKGPLGCCVEFDQEKLLKAIDKVSEIRKKSVQYKEIAKINSTKIKAGNLPFIKRWPYRFEQEFRVIWEGETDRDIMEIKIPRNVIVKITLSPKLDDRLFKTIKEKLKKKPYYIPLKKINLSTVYKNDEWIGAFRKIADSHAKVGKQ